MNRLTLIIYQLTRQDESQNFMNFKAIRERQN